MKRIAALSLLLVVAALPARAPAAASEFRYTASFEKGAGAEWSQTRTTRSPDGTKTFLGEFANDATALLRLTDLPPLSHVTVSFDFLALRSWDGNNPAPNAGPDVWSVSVVGGPSLLRSSFSNSASRQSFPDAHPEGDNAARAGASSSNTLGYPAGIGGDSIYRLSYEFESVSPAIVLSFAASGTGPANLADEAWGLDNVTVTAASSCGTLCVRTVPGTKLSDVTAAAPGAENPVSSVALELGAIRVDAGGDFVEQAVALVRSPSLPGPELLAQSAGGVSTRYRRTMRVCLEGKCSFALGTPSAGVGKKVGELWTGRIQVFAHGVVVTDVPGAFFQTV